MALAECWLWILSLPWPVSGWTDSQLCGGGDTEAPGIQNQTFPILCPGHLASATTDLMKLDHEEEPQLSEPYLSKQKKLMVSVPTFLSPSLPSFPWKGKTGKLAES